VILAKPELPADNELIPRLLAGDNIAYSQVVTAYHGLMVHLARAIVGEAIADEVAQESWVSVMRALPGFKGRSSLKTWILRITTNTAKSRLRHEARSVSLEGIMDDQPVVDPARFVADGHWSNPPATWHVDSPEALLASEALRDCIHRALSSLPPLQCAAITLRDMQGFDMETICKILDVSESNGRVLLHRARSSIQQAIDEHERS
jgi:RNA polymerase sigma-70 factor (ECF subfamily)